MDLYIWFILIWLIFLILEIFFISWDFLALSISSFITSLLIYLFKFELNLSVFLFFIISIFSWILVYILYKKFLNKVNKFKISIEDFWDELYIVQILNWEKVIFHQWNYYSILNSEEVNAWDNVKVEEFKDNFVIVKKIF